MFKIEVSEETADNLFRDIFKQDYRGLRSDIAKLEADPNIDNLDREDLEFNKRIVSALEIVMEYYFVDEDRNKLINGSY